MEIYLMANLSFFTVVNAIDFENKALSLFKYHMANNSVYAHYVSLLGIATEKVQYIEQIPFLPIQFFKTKKISLNNSKNEKIFTSSGTSGLETSKHYVSDINIYENSFNKAFQLFYGAPEEYVILALLPSYLERKGSSLIYMVDALIKQSKNQNSGFYLSNIDDLATKIKTLDKAGKKIILIGVSFALLDLIEKFQFNLKNTFIMETGGMKGRRKEIIREELHQKLCEGFGVSKIHSEYGMTELLSQAYSKGEGVFQCPPWMKVIARDTSDPLSTVENGKTGALNIIDLANTNSCPFIATDDLGLVLPNGNFKVLGRFDNATIRGCNLLINND